MGIPVFNPNPMTVEEFFAFTDTRPDEEKWELIEGEPVLNATASRLHQRIVLNIATRLHGQAIEHDRGWEVLPGLGVRITPTNLPVPDILVRPSVAPYNDAMSRECDDIIVAFEVLSPSTKERDLRWKRRAYTGLPSLTHYVVVAQDVAEIAVFERATGFSERRLAGSAAVLDIAPLGISLPLAEIYRGTGLL